MKLGQLRYLVAILEAGSITSAARLLGVSVPTVSKAIQRLEADVGARLLVPDGRGVAVTAAGRDLARRASRVLGEWESLERAIADARDVRATVRIASFAVFTSYFLGELVDGELADRDVSVMSAIPGAVEEAIATAAADIGFTYVATPTGGIKHVHVGSAPMVIAARADGSHGAASLEELPFAVPGAGVAGALVRQRSADGWPDEQPRTIRYRVGAMESAIELCRRDRAVAYLPAFVVELHNRHAAEGSKLATRPAPGSARMDVHVVHRADEPDVGLVHRIASATGRIIALQPT
jgi:molybdate transport repressor ModE-like protein